MSYQINHMRLNGENKHYWANQLKEFADFFVGKLWGSSHPRIITEIQFGKQANEQGYIFKLHHRMLIAKFI